MDRRYEERKAAMLAECEVSPEVFRGVQPRLEQFVKPFAALLQRKEQKQHAMDYMSGLMSDLERKNVESIAYRHDQDRRALQRFVGCAEWDYQPLIQELARQVGQELGEADAVIVFDPSGFPKKGKQSVGVARQWCGRLGKVDNSQVAVYMAYVSREGQALVNTRLYLPEEWAKDRARRQAAGVPKHIKFQTRHAQALDMLQEQGSLLPHAWIGGDDEMGKNAAFRRDLHDRQEQYLLAVPGEMLMRNLEVPPPARKAAGRAPKQPFQRIDRWRDSLSDEAWTRVNVRDGEKSALEVEVALCRVQTKLKGRVMPYEETAVVIRCLDEQGATKYDFYFSDAPRETPAQEFARVALAAHRVEEAIKRSKSEAGLADYEVRTWLGWHHHQALSLIATWFLVLETRRGKKMDSGAHGSTDPRWDRHVAASCLPMPHARSNRTKQNTATQTKRRSTLLPLQST
jgi:SRSO17 transposase